MVSITGVEEAACPVRSLCVSNGVVSMTTGVIIGVDEAVVSITGVEEAVVSACPVRSLCVSNGVVPVASAPSPMMTVRVAWLTLPAWSAAVKTR